MSREIWTHHSGGTVEIVDGNIIASTFAHAPIGGGVTAARKALRACGWKLPRKVKQVDVFGRVI